MKNLNYLMHHILYQILKIILSTSSKSWRKDYYFFNKFELLTPEKMKFGSTISKIKKEQNVKIVPYLENTEVVFVHCSIVNNNHQQNSRVPIR